MNNELYAFALKNTLTEIQNICSDIKNAFMFKEDGEVIAGDANTPEKTIVQVIDAFEGIFEKADALEGVEAITLEGTKGKLLVSNINGLYLVTVASGKADMKYVNTVTRVLIPTVFKLAENFNPTSLKNRLPEPEASIETPAFRNENPLMAENEEPEESAIKEPSEIFKPEPSLPEAPVNQLIVENLGGLLVPSDTVRIDNETLVQWTELYEGRKLESVEIQTFDGKVTQCKVKPIKETKYEGKGIVQMPEKVQLTLEIRKGELVRVKPLIE